LRSKLFAMKKSFLLLFSLVVVLSFTLKAQQITVSEPDRDDPRSYSFEVLGKIGGKILVYKNYRDGHTISVFDPEMKLLGKQQLNMPDRLMQTDFLAYANHFYMLYQFQRKSTVYCMAVKMDSDGNLLSEPMQLDSTLDANSIGTNRLYSLVVSEDKKKIMIFKINSQNEKSHVLTTCLFDQDFGLIRKSRIELPMPQRNDFLAEFALDNDGDLICIRASGTAQNDNINKVSLISKKANYDNVYISDLGVKGIYLDDIHIKVDNLNKHYLITSFFGKQRRGNIEGIYFTLWDKNSDKELLNASTYFSDEFKEDAKGQNGARAAFNDYYLKNILVRRDGGFMMISESVFSSSRGSTLNRWDYLYGSPFWSPMDYYSWNNPMGGMWLSPWGRNNAFFNNNNQVRYFAENIAVISFDAKGNMEWSNMIRKNQFDDNSEKFIGFSMLNSGDQLNFIFNVQEKNQNVLTNQAITPDGRINRNPGFKNVDRGHEFMPRLAKQVGLRQMIVPCMYRGYTCFAKIDY
jgi:hypothetical protein